MSLKRSLSYCLDTSAWIAAWDERYPMAHFPKLWQHLEDGLQQGVVSVHESVIDELSKKSLDLAKWLKQFPSAIIPFSTDIQIKSREILLRHPRLVMERKAAFAADPFVIACAITRKHVVVTEEGKGSLAKPKIPDVCLAEGCECVRLLEMIRARNWVI